MRNKSKCESIETDPPEGATYLGSIRFHQSFLLSANPHHGHPRPLRVSYCDLDYREPTGPDPESGDTGPTILFLPGAGERRYYGALWADALAKKYKLRYLHPDRFGIGGTEEVDLNHRIEAFVDLVEGLLKHLQIKHVALACHSAGAIYTFNTLLSLRHILHPIRPLICFMAPWVLPKHSKAFIARAVCLIPNRLIRRAHLIDQAIPLSAKWFVSDVYNGAERLLSRAKRLNWRSRTKARLECSSHGEHSSDDVQGPASPTRLKAQAGPERGTASSRNSMQEIKDDGETLLEDPDDYEGEETDCEEWIDPEFYLQCMFAENSNGIGDDLLLCLKRGGISSWGLFADYIEAINLLRSQETKLIALERSEPRTSKLRVQTFFASQDSLIGDQGAAWFEGLWMGQEDWVDYHSECKEGVGHDELPARRSGCLEWLMKEVAESWTPADDLPIGEKSS